MALILSEKSDLLLHRYVPLGSSSSSMFRASKRTIFTVLLFHDGFLGTAVGSIYAFGHRGSDRVDFFLLVRVSEDWSVKLVGMRICWICIGFLGEEPGSRSWWLWQCFVIGGSHFFPQTAMSRVCTELEFPPSWFIIVDS